MTTMNPEKTINCPLVYSTKQRAKECSFFTNRTLTVVWYETYTHVRIVARTILVHIQKPYLNDFVELANLDNGKIEG